VNVTETRESRLDRFFGIPAYIFRTYQFAAGNGQTRLEVRFGLVNDVLQFTLKDDNYHASYEGTLGISDANENLVASRIWKNNLYTHSFAETNDRLHLNEERHRFFLSPGDYEIKLEVVDLVTRRRLRREYPLVVKPFPSDSLQLSSLVVGRMNSSADRHDSLEYNFVSLLTDEVANQGVYYEVYGVKPSDTLDIEYRLQDWKDRVLEEWSATVPVTDTTVRRFDKLDGKLKYQGPQSLTISITAHGEQARATTNFRFQTIKLPAGVEVATVDNRELSYRPLHYIARRDEFNRMAESKPTLRDSLIEEFWRERDPTPGTVANELRDEFYRRVLFADTRFSVHGLDKAGWETDRGRIYIIHGPPEEVHHQLQENGKAPYEIWFYPKQDRYFFFQDKNGSGDFQLTHR